MTRIVIRIWLDNLNGQLIVSNCNQDGYICSCNSSMCTRGNLSCERQGVQSEICILYQVESIQAEKFVPVKFQQCIFHCFA